MFETNDLAKYAVAVFHLKLKMSGNRGRPSTRRNQRNNEMPSASSSGNFLFPEGLDQEAFWTTIRNLANQAPRGRLNDRPGSGVIAESSDTSRPTVRSSHFSVREPIKVDYKLTTGTSFELWFDLFKSELRHHNLLDVVEPNEAVSEDYSDLEMQQRRAEVRYILVNRLDSTHHSLVISCEDPKKALEILKAHYLATLNIGSAPLRKRLQDFKFNPKKSSFSAYLAKIEEMIREYERVSPPMAEREKCELLLNNLAGCYPELDTVVLARNANNNFEELKLIALQIEARRNDRRELNVVHRTVAGTAMNTQSVKRQAPQTGPSQKRPRCFNCNAPGHTMQSCIVPKGSKIKWCDSCKGLVADHVESACPQAQKAPSQAGSRKQKRKPGQSKTPYKPRTGTFKKSQPNKSETQQ